MAACTASPAAILLKAMQSIVRRRIAFRDAPQDEVWENADMIRTKATLT
jgi:hypothetical protein